MTRRVCVARMQAVADPVATYVHYNLIISGWLEKV